MKETKHMTPEDWAELWIKEGEESGRNGDIPDKGDAWVAFLKRTVAGVVRRAERAAVRRCLDLVDKVKDERSRNHFDTELSPLAAFEWACEQAAEEIGEAFPEVVDELNAEYAAECRALADRANALAPQCPIEFVPANTTFRMGGCIYHKAEVEKIVEALERGEASKVLNHSTP